MMARLAGWAWFALVATCAAFMLWGLWRALDGFVEEKARQAPSLERAQYAFERGATAWPAPADFDAWRASGALKCRDHKQLRICEAMWPLFSPADGKPFGKDRVTFACSVEECAWVDP